jgi:hypothetical protein
MKNPCTLLLCVCITLFSHLSFAQHDKVPLNEPNYNKPKLFQQLPEQVPVNMENIIPLFSAELGRPVSIILSDAAQFRLEGEIISVTSKYENTIQSVVLRSTNYNGARLTISKITAADGNVTYKGRIISMEHGDLYELQNQDGRFVLVKRNFHDLVNE